MTDDELKTSAEHEPAAALERALAHPPESRATALEAVAEGAVRQPRILVDLARALLARDSELGSAFGSMSVGALTNAAEFSAAMQLAVSGSVTDQADWFGIIFRRWGEKDPETAAAACASLSAPVHAAGLRALIEGWAEHDPAALADFARRLPEGAARDQALATALFKWAERDPAALAQWLRVLPPGREFDAGAAVLVTVTDGANRSAEDARRWAEAIADAELRRATLQQVRAESHPAAENPPPTLP